MKSRGSLCRKEHRCDCARPDRTLSVLQQNLKGGSTGGLTWIIPVAEKSNVRERYIY